MCLGTFGKSIPYGFGSVTKPGYIPATSQYCRDILTRRGRNRQQHKHCKSETNSTHVDLQNANRTAGGITNRPAVHDRKITSVTTRCATSGQYSQGPGTQRKTSPSTATWQTDGNDR